jgi:hypothetical protein
MRTVQAGCFTRPQVSRSASASDSANATLEALRSGAAARLGGDSRGTTAHRGRRWSVRSHVHVAGTGVRGCGEDELRGVSRSRRLEVVPALWWTSVPVPFEGDGYPPVVDRWTRTWMSITSFAARPGTDVDPMCSIAPCSASSSRRSCCANVASHRSSVPGSRRPPPTAPRQRRASPRR